MTSSNNSPQPQTPICAIGASAGGVVALREFFSEMRSDLGLAYVVIVHLMPDHPSVLGEILSQCTKMPVQQIEDGPHLKPNCVYVIPPDRELVIDGDNIRARPFTEPRGRRAPIDMFFRSIANSRGDGIAVILSGSGADGSLGVRAIKEAGGVILVQDPDEAEYDMMPKNAIAMNVADYVGPLARIAKQIADIAQSKEAVRSLDTDSAANELRRIVSFLRARTGHDFSHYKQATVRRRVLRRMQVNKCDNLAGYAEFVRENLEEANELFADLLISVTSFFRDAAAFDALAQKAIPAIFDDCGEDGEIRVWSVGCATGEEAYSIAILLLEESQRRKVRIPIQIFASDLDQSALAVAREGRYPKTIEADISEQRLQRFFQREGEYYCIRQELRDLILFASHSVLRDPPFINLDLIACRNLMIYLERNLQEQLCALFHYALKSNRFLFLGSAETADLAAEYYRSADRDCRLYRSIDRESRIPPDLSRPPYKIIEHAAGGALKTVEIQPRHAQTSHMEMLEQSAPPSILVDNRQHILNLSPSAGRYILHSGGPISAELTAIVRPELRLDLKVALERAFHKNETNLTLPVAVAFNGDRKRVVIQVTPQTEGEDAPHSALVYFIEGEKVEDDGDFAAAARPADERRLLEELKTVHERLNASRHEHNTTIQELRAANEELQSINEEYRSTAEELETSKEELQSMNEELQTVNAELKNKLRSISSAHNDLQNLTMATEIGTLFLDLELKIRMFTPPTAELFNITDADIGRTITDFTHRMLHDGVERDVRSVLKDLAPVESEIQSRDGRWYMMRIRPYRTTENRIEGVVVTFVEITLRLQAERQLRENEAHLSLVVGELNHRVKNSLAVVQAMAHQTLRGKLAPEALRAFEGRLQSLAEAHTLLTESNWKNAGLKAIAKRSLHACGAKKDRYSIDGPDIDLLPSQAVAFAMALHELCTNAVKYGALHNDHGKVRIEWRILDDESDRLRLIWSEKDGPAVNKPESSGFGTIMVQKALAQELDGDVTVEFRRDGVVCTITAPIGASLKTPDASP